MSNYNYDAQEKVVEALWNFLRDNNRKPHNSSCVEPDGLGETHANLQAVQDALSGISGWSEKIFDIMKFAETDKNALINEIKKIEW